MTKVEQETIISFDYGREQVDIYTTRRGEKNGVLRRLPEGVATVTPTVNGEREVAWSIRIPEKYARRAQQITVGPQKGQRLASTDEEHTDQADQSLSQAA